MSFLPSFTIKVLLGCKSRVHQNKSTAATPPGDHRSPFCSLDDEGSAPDVGRKFTKCSTCKYGAECDEDSEDVW